MSQNHTTKKDKEKYLPEKLESDHSSVIENNNAFSYTNEELTAIWLFKIAAGMKELSKNGNKKETIEGEIIEDKTVPLGRLAFSTEYIQKWWDSISIIEMHKLLNLCHTAGQIAKITTDDGIVYWAYSSY
jgi:hypothetical protein